MTLHPPRKTWTTPTIKDGQRAAPAVSKSKKAEPITLGMVLGDGLRRVIDERRRRAELDAAGFKRVGGA